MNDYGFVVVHIPHASVYFPSEYKDGYLISEEELQLEVRRMTDAFCDELYDAEGFNIRVISTVSRLVCDVERFRDDSSEPCAKYGQGLMYTRTSTGKKLRENNLQVREQILAEIYDPHHKKLTEAVDASLEKYGFCLIIDGHSFNSNKRVKLDNFFSMPDFDIGADKYHTPIGLIKELTETIRSGGYTPRLNSPYGGAITPMKHYGKDPRVFSVMFETNRKLYMNEETMVHSKGYEKTREFCHILMRVAADYIAENHERLISEHN